MGNNIVFVVGAGASFAYGFPLGWQLIPNIRAVLSSPSLSQEISPHDRDEIGICCNRLDCATISSIDLFMQQETKRTGNLNNIITKYCKYGIVKKILQCEEDFPLGSSNKNDWLEHLVKIIAEEAKYDASKFKESRIKFITFNYDRLLEYRIREYFIKVLNLSEVESNILVQEFSDKCIVHVYGQIGKFDDIDFGATADTNRIHTLTKNINIIGDERELFEEKRIQEILAETDQLHFLGFGFNKENVSKLKLQTLPYIRLVSGTCDGLGKAERDSILQFFWENLEKPLELKPNLRTEKICLNYIKEKVEFSPLSKVVHLRKGSTGDIIKVNAELSKVVWIQRGVSPVSFFVLKKYDTCFLEMDCFESHTFLGIFDPTS